MMMMDGAAASPGRGNKKDETISRLWSMHKAGIFSKEEVREMVFKHVGVSALRTAPMTQGGDDTSSSTTDSESQTS